MDFGEIVQKRYAVRSFTEKKVSEEDLDKLLEMIQMAASSFGIQPYKVYIVKDEETLQKLQVASWNQPQIGTCSHLFVFCAMKNVTERTKQYTEEMKKAGTPQEKIEGFTNIVNGYMKQMSKEETTNWSAKQTYIALNNGMNGATSIGIDSCPMEGFEPDKYSEILKLPENHVPVALLPIGYAADKPKPKLRIQKKDLFEKR